MLNFRRFLVLDDVNHELSPDHRVCDFVAFPLGTKRLTVPKVIEVSLAFDNCQVLSTEIGLAVSR